MEAAILLLIFNRPETTTQVWEQIKLAKPKRLYVAADGPRKSVPTDAIKCAQTREVINKGINWPCEVKTLLRDVNLGCGVAVSEAITWFFKQEEQGIILEDDCLIDATFFPFCENLLEKYSAYEQVMGIGACNFQNGKQRGTGSYYFSKYHHCWGWASWRRAWNSYSFDLNRWSEGEIVKRIEELMKSHEEREYWISIYKGMKEGLVDTWDYQWLFSMWMNNGVSITPNVNLVNNIGFGESATHTQSSHSFIKGLEKGSIHSILHPQSLLVNDQADVYTFRHHYHISPRLANRIRNIGYKMLPEAIFVHWRNLKKKWNGL